MTDLADQIERLSAAATPGQVFRETGDDHWTADIDLVSEAHYGAIQVYGRTQEITHSRRDTVLAALNAQAEVEALRATLKWYADQFCEYPDNEGCGKYEDDTCSGCRARKALEAKP
jgi:hypothetical protein